MSSCIVKIAVNIQRSLHIPSISYQVKNIKVVSFTLNLLLHSARYLRLSSYPKLFNVVKFIVLFHRTLISRLALVESVDRLVLNEMKKDLQLILGTYKTAFYGPLFAQDLLRPILQHIVRDLAQVIETVK